MSTGPIPPPPPGPRTWLPERALPPYRYVPGLHPHPFRHPDGHLYTDGSAPTEAPWSPDGAWSNDPAWRWACALFDQRYYWEAHEAWEALWHQVTRGSPHHALLQGLIQVAACVLKHHLNHTAGADRLQQRARAHLEVAMAAHGPQIHGLDLPETLSRLAHFRSGGDWPRLARATADQPALSCSER